MLENAVRKKIISEADGKRALFQFVNNWNYFSTAFKIKKIKILESS